MVSLENKIQSGIIQTEPVIIRNIYVYKYLYLETINEKKKEAMNLKERKEWWYTGDAGGRKGRNVITVLYNLKNLKCVLKLEFNLDKIMSLHMCKDHTILVYLLKCN